MHTSDNAGALARSLPGLHVPPPKFNMLGNGVTAEIQKTGSSGAEPNGITYVLSSFGWWRNISMSSDSILVTTAPRST